MGAMDGGLVRTLHITSRFLWCHIFCPIKKIKKFRSISRRGLLEELPQGARLGVRQRFPLGMIMSGDTELRVAVPNFQHNIVS